MIGNFKLVIKLQTVPGGVLCISLVTWLTSILGLLQTYHNSDRHNFNCDPKPSDFIRQLCYNNYISAITKPHGLIPRDVVGITLLIVCGVYIIFTIYGDVTLRKRPGYRNENTNTFLCIYFIQVGFRMLFLVFMSRLVYSYEKIVLPDFFECDVNQTNSQTTPSPLNQTKITLTCHDLHHEEKSKINKAFIVGNVLFMVCSIFEVLHLWCKRETCLQYLIGHLEGFRADDSPQNGELKIKVKVDDLKLEEQNKQTGMPATESVRCQEVPQPRPSATSVASGVVSCPQTEDLRTSKEKAFLSFVIKYFDTTNPQSVEEFDRLLEYARALRLAIVGVSGGSLVITVKCESLMSLEELWKDYSSGHLGEVVQNCFVTEQILKELNLAELRLKTTIDIEEYKACKLFFEKDPHRGTSFSEFHPTSSTSESLQKNEQRGKSEQKTKIMETAKLEGTSPLTVVPTTGHGRELEESRGRTGLPEKPTITNAETEVDKDLTVTWSEAEANSTNRSIKYRLECRKKFMKGSKEVFQQGNIVETRHTITGLEYDAGYEVKLFAVNEQGDSEPDVRTFKTKSAVSAYTSALKSSIMYRTEFQPKLLASRTISNVKTDEIFTNLLMQDGRIDLIGDDETCYSRREVLECYGKVSGTPVKHCSEIFLGIIDDQESANSILVVGKAGIGKSLFCQKVIRDWANHELFHARENTEIPNLKFVYLLTFHQLNLLDNNCVTLREILNWSSVLDDKCDIDDSTFEYIVKHPKQVMIILDGYDEYSQQDYIAGNLEEQHPNDARHRMPVAALCSKLIKGKILKETIVMITSRPDESDKMGGNRFKRCVEIAGFSSEQVKEYIEKYFKNNENMKNAVLKHVMDNENLVSFAHIPMLCYLLCSEMEYTLAESENPDDLPVSTTDIYTKLVDIFELKHCAESKYRQKEIPEQLKPPSVIKNTLDKLSELAAKLLVEGKVTFDEREMEGEFELEEVNKLKGSSLLYCGQPFRTALITTTKHFGFTHLTVQEFLAARWFVKENRVPDPAKCSEMVFQFMAGMLSNEKNEELMEKLIDAPFMPPHLRLRCLKEYRDSS